MDYITLHQKPEQQVLLVDGNDKQRFALAALLRTKLRYSLVEAVSGADALAKCKAMEGVKADLILLDLSTIDEGYDTIVELKNLLPDAPLIVLVQYGEYQDAAEALLLGAYDFLTKPVVEERMNVTLRNAIALRDARREAKKMSGFEGEAAKRLGSPTGETLISLVNSDGDARKIEEIELAAIRFAVRFYNGRMTEVARKLGIGRSTLYRKLGAVG